MASVARYFWNFSKSHPYKNGTGVLVDYNVASLMLPMIIVGASVGVLLNKMFPAITIPIVLAVLMMFVSFTTMKKLCNIIAAERKQYGPVCGGKKFVPKEGTTEMQAIKTK